MFSVTSKKKPYWDRVKLNVVNTERLIEAFDAPNWNEPNVWDLLQGKIYRRLEIYDYAHDYAEPGYSLEKGQTGILFGNWNYLSKAGFDLLETRFALEWCDEWFTCSGCGKAVRHQCDSFSWSPSFYSADGECICLECMANDPDEYFSLVSHTDRGAPEEGPSYSILHECGVFGADFSPPDGWEVLEDPDVKRYGDADDERAAQHFLSLGFEKVLLYKDRPYEYRVILGYKDPDSIDDEEDEEEETEDSE